MFKVRSQSVSTVKKSNATISFAWPLREPLQLGPDRRGAGGAVLVRCGNGWQVRSESEIRQTTAADFGLSRLLPMP
jgi:hypothetical protein